MDSEVQAGRGPANFEQALGDVMQRAFDIMVAKRESRGHENISQQGMLGVIQRAILDKGSRLIRETEANELRHRLLKLVPASKFSVVMDLLPVSVPSAVDFKDDLLDVANYMFIAHLMEDGLWSLPMRKDVEIDD